MLHRSCDGQQEIKPLNEPDIVIMRSMKSTAPGRQRRQATRGSCTTVDNTVGDRLETVATEPFCFPDISSFRKCQNFQNSDCKAAPAPRAKLKRRASYESLRPDPSPSQVVPRGTRRLQLPPFDILGISGPATDRIISPVSPPAGLPRQSLSFDSQLAAVTARLSTSPLAGSTHSPKHHRSSTLPPTPPAEDECVGWDIHSGDMSIPEETTPHRESSSDMEEERRSQKTPPAGSMRIPCPPPDQSTAQQNGDKDETPLNGDNIILPEGGSGFWLERAIQAAVSSLLVSKTRGEAVKVVSQTLPSPAIDPSASSTPSDHVTAFTSVIQGIQGRLQPGQSPYINITHAVPHKFSLLSLPASPPSTPNLVSSGDDYFDMTVFSNATPVVSYHDFRGTIPSATSSFPAPIVPPYSVHIAVVERYLPPPSPQEYLDLFSHRGPSVLVDRLVELSPNGGSLVFIYPTKQGALSFKTNYLGPVLDPLLRQLVVVNELSADMGMALGRMASVSQMEDYGTMKDNLTQLCQKLSQRPGDPEPSENGSGTRYTLIHADKGEVHLDRKLWAEWYIQQETQRARDVLNEYWRNGNRLPSIDTSQSSNYAPINREVTSAMLLREILEGIRKRPPSEGIEPREGIELGVFVIRRS